MSARDTPEPYHIPVSLHLRLNPTTATKMIGKSVFSDTKRGPLYLIKRDKRIPASVIRSHFAKKKEFK